MCQLRSLLDNVGWFIRGSNDGCGTAVTSHANQAMMEWIVVHLE